MHSGCQEDLGAYGSLGRIAAQSGDEVGVGAVWRARTSPACWAERVGLLLDSVDFELLSTTTQSQQTCQSTGLTRISRQARRPSTRSPRRALPSSSSVRADKGVACTDIVLTLELAQVLVLAVSRALLS